MYIPASTYRIQFNKDFTFKHFNEKMSYFISLGIGALYSNPFFEAVQGSIHGYDLTNPHKINKEIGTLKEFETLALTLKSRKIGWIQDIVPNHMAYSPDNKWLMDVLQNGRNSDYSCYFDVDWDHPAFPNKIMVPLLGKSLDETIENNELKLYKTNDEWGLDYYDFKLPLSVESFRKKEMEITQTVGQLSKISFTELVQDQHYVLTPWNEVEKNLNYRRFFTINGLICLSMENDDVFEHYHSFILSLISRQLISGLRIDHIDGLKKPGHYFDKLRSVVGDKPYLVIEKILQKNETFEYQWPVQGNTGYDFLAYVNNLFTNQKGYLKILEYYCKITGQKKDFQEYVHEKKSQILNRHFKADLDNITRYIVTKGMFPKIDPEQLTEALGEILIICPVYKLYSQEIPMSVSDAMVMKEIITNARNRKPELALVFDELEQVLLIDKEIPELQKVTASGLLLRLMQYTGPLMAKGIEDTAMYTWNAFIAHNEVGDSIQSEGINISEFHKLMQNRRKYLPATLNTTSTHDTKRGEDTRARLNVLSDIPEAWLEWVNKCMTMNQSFKTFIDGSFAPDNNEEYFLYQVLLGVVEISKKPDEGLFDRISAFIKKALREGKVHSDWNQPNEAYEEAVILFIKRILFDSPEFTRHFNSFFSKIKAWGINNSLNQVVLKSTCPGIPDFYQGTELWDFSLVDPDNRRRIDFEGRNKLLQSLKRSFQNQPADFLISIIKDKENGKIKLWFTHRLMIERARNPDAFINAGYVPLSVTGLYKENVLAFARIFSNTWYIIIIPLHGAAIHNENIKGRKQKRWKNTRVEIPEHAPWEWELLWDCSKLEIRKSISLSDLIIDDIPVVLKGILPENTREGGVLLAITSLPGKYGIGGFGNEAYDFVDFMKECGLRNWQILPLQPPGRDYSSYSSISAFAGNTMLIDPDWLVSKKLIHHKPDILQEMSRVEYGKTEEMRTEVIHRAFITFANKDMPLMKMSFDKFCYNNEYWLTDYCLFHLLKSKHENAPWYLWPEKYKNREKQALIQFESEFETELQELKFGQFLFYEQFKQFKQYAESFGIKIIGDLPIYVSYDSVDVWSHSHLFSLADDKNMTGIAGVPPDFFSETGQNWNMPVYDWKNMKRERYRWWISRIKHNLEFCDKLRIDHFRALSSYWEIPAGETFAVKGKWVKGPGSHFLSALQVEFPDMPFIAEDLGEIDNQVYLLRDAFSLPGMLVLQFAFDENMAYSVHIPHQHKNNTVVFTGTHDNNTTLGWYNANKSADFRARLSAYTGDNITAAKVVWQMIRMAFASVANTAIIPMQDFLGLDESARLNLPGKSQGNWLWKMKSSDINSTLSAKIRALLTLYGRM